ncbi:MAG: tRNA adenosine(34) deaminase TadA [Acidobacteria bacterium]|nr:tRNA adenosine(34) deaminase TadA [Acidobacteriota bacterium]
MLRGVAKEVKTGLELGLDSGLGLHYHSCLAESPGEAAASGRRSDASVGNLFGRALAPQPVEPSEGSLKDQRGRKNDSPAEGVEEVADHHWMEAALEEARKAPVHGDVPVGAVVVRGGEIIGRGHNRREVDEDPLAHAELLALAQAAEATRGWRLDGCSLFVTLEPCAMCAGALVNSRIDRLVFAASDPKGGFCGSLGNLVEDSRLNHRLPVTRGLLAEEAGKLLKDFFATLRGKRLKESDL